MLRFIVGFLYRNRFNMSVPFVGYVLTHKQKRITCQRDEIKWNVLFATDSPFQLYSKPTYLIKEIMLFLFCRSTLLYARSFSEFPENWKNAINYWFCLCTIVKFILFTIASFKFKICLHTFLLKSKVFRISLILFIQISTWHQFIIINPANITSSLSLIVAVTVCQWMSLMSSKRIQDYNIAISYQLLCNMKDELPSATLLRPKPNQYWMKELVYRSEIPAQFYQMVLHCFLWPLQFAASISNFNDFMDLFAGPYGRQWL